ncbi:MAG: NfeD family protein [Muribaculaceae bacterium]|nr:NfeD family protein [Muribaculaceae bacterium]
MGLWSFWLILGVGFLVAELLTMSMTCIYVGIGALAAMACALLGGEWISSIIVFVASTALIYLTTYRWRHKITEALHRGAAHTATGMDALIGRTGIVVEAPDSLRMRIDGDVWKVRPVRHGSELKPGDHVRVVGYDSIILSVETIPQS